MELKLPNITMQIDHLNVLSKVSSALWKMSNFMARLFLFFF